MSPTVSIRAGGARVENVNEAGDLDADGERERRPQTPSSLPGGWHDHREVS